MSHRTQITLTDAQYSRLQAESAQTGVSLAELVRRSLNAVYGSRDGGWGTADILAESFGAWRDRQLDGEAYVNALRRGMARRLTG